MGSVLELMDSLSPAEQDAFSLSRAALLIDQARAEGNKKALGAALAHNVEVWVAVQTLVDNAANGLSAELRANLSKLSKYVTEKSLSDVNRISDAVVDTLVNINLQISEGLLEGATRAVSAARA